jgi:integrase
MRLPYTLCKRGKFWYCTVIIRKDGIDTRKVFSTKQTSKIKAKDVCDELLKKGLLYLDSEIRPEIETGYVFGDYAKSWWVLETCPYIRETKMNGTALTPRYIQNNKAALKNHILPAFGRKDIRKIGHLDIDKWKFSLIEEKHLMPKTANNILSVLNTMLKYAWRHDMIVTNPCDKVVQLSNLNPKKRGVLEPTEVVKLFSTLDAWVSDIAYLMNLLACTTGLRLGEVQALQPVDIKKDYILVQHSFDDKYGLKTTKTRQARAIPVRKEILAKLRMLNYGQYLFSLDDPTKPVGKGYPEEHLKRALSFIGVSRFEQKQRVITFHSWRHYLNSQLRKTGIDDNVTRQVTGHSTPEMTELYSHYSKDDLKSILGVSNDLFSRAFKKEVLEYAEVIEDK